MGKILNINFNQNTDDNAINKNISSMIEKLEEINKNNVQFEEFVYENLCYAINHLKKFINNLNKLKLEDVRLLMAIKNISFLALDLMNDISNISKGSDIYGLTVFYEAMLAIYFVEFNNSIIKEYNSQEFDYYSFKSQFKDGTDTLFDLTKKNYYYLKLSDMVKDKYGSLDKEKEEFFDFLITDAIEAFNLFEDDTCIKYFRKVLDASDEYNILNTSDLEKTKGFIMGKCNPYKIYYLTVRNVDGFSKFFEVASNNKEIKDKLLKLKKSIYVNNARNNRSVFILISKIVDKIENIISNIGKVENPTETYLKNNLEMQTINNFIDYLFTVLKRKESLEEVDFDIVWNEIRQSVIRDKLNYIKDNRTFSKCDFNEKYNGILENIISDMSLRYSDNMVLELELISELNKIIYLLKKGMFLESVASEMNLEYVLDEVNDTDYSNRDNDEYINVMYDTLVCLTIDTSLEEFSDREYTKNRTYEYIKNKHNLLKKELSKKKKR